VSVPLHGVSAPANAAFVEPRVLSEEVYHVCFAVIRETNPEVYRATQRWYEHRLRNGADPTFSLDEAFSKAMGLEEVGKATGLPRDMVRNARGLFWEAGSLPDCVIDRVKPG